jgi:diamine N-acetyltransferase
MSQLRTATSHDIETIRQLAEEVWPVAYGAILKPGQIEYMLDMMYSSSSLLKQMEEEGCEFIIAELDKPVGFASFSEIGDGLFKLNKLYVLSTMQGLGVGSRLAREVIRRCEERGGTLLELQVNKNNEAKLFYEGLGFEVDHEDVFDIGQGYVMDDYIMRYALNPNLSA